MLTCFITVANKLIISFRGRGGCHNLEGGGAKYVTRIYLYGEKSCSYGVIVKIERGSTPPAPLVQPPLSFLICIFNVTPSSNVYNRCSANHCMTIPKRIVSDNSKYSYVPVCSVALTSIELVYTVVSHMKSINIAVALHAREDLNRLLLHSYLSYR